MSSSSLVSDSKERPITCRNATTTDQCDLVHQNRGQQLIDKYLTVYQESLGRCTKLGASLKLKRVSNNIFRTKCPVPFAAMETVDKD